MTGEAKRSMIRAMQDYITAKQVAARLGRDVSSVHKWLLKAGVKPAKMLAGEGSRGQLVAHYDAAEVDRLVRKKYGRGLSD